ncbi:MAG: cytochrome d ubiquinol oxidase subunit II, partial [Betaproteobacteria bacterium]|nr:cytochrome d ubiquinol oxidase subunit II [Betaproteobacteria bacterium]
MPPSDLALFWAGVIATAILVYVILDGFDLGVGILFGTTGDEAYRTQMMDAIAPVWDGNETWLVVIGAGLFAAFPVVYTVFLGAFYIPALLLLIGLIFRGVAFEFRDRSNRMRKVWDWGFCLGSVVAAFVQGAAIGAMMRGIPVADGQYAGGAFDWVAPFPLLTGVGLVFGYALLGAAWLVLKSEGSLRDWAYQRLPWMAGAMVVVLGIATVATLNRSELAQSHWGERPWGIVFPILGAIAVAGVFLGAWRRRDGVPFAMAALFFLSAYLTLGV